MQKPKPTTVYRSLLTDALRVAWGRKQLWVFGLFAALLSTGGAWEMTAKNFRHLSAMRDASLAAMRGTLGAKRMFGGFVQDALSLDPTRASMIAGFVIVAGLLAIVASVVSQGALVAGTGKKEIADPEAVAASKRSFADLLLLNLLHKAAHGIVTLIAVVPLFALVERPSTQDILATSATCLVVFPLTIVISTLFMLASADMVQKNTHALDAVHHAVRAWRAHWLAAFELGLILFVSMIATGILFVLSVALLSIPFAVVVSVALAFANATAFLIVNVLGAFLLVLLLFGFVGMVTTFQYAAWVRFYELATGKKRMVSKTHRIWNGK